MKKIRFNFLATVARRHDVFKKAAAVFALAIALLAGQTICRAQNVQAVPLYRLKYFTMKNSGILGVNTNFWTQHFYTSDKAERDSAIKNVSGYDNGFEFDDEGLAGYVSPKQLSGTVPLYRLHGTGGTYFYTTDKNEKNQAVANDGYKSEGIVGYVCKTQMPGTTPLYRIYRAASGQLPDDHLYTTDENEKYAAIHKADYADEGIVGYVWTSAVTLSPDGKIVMPIILKKN